MHAGAFRKQETEMTQALLETYSANTSAAATPATTPIIPVETQLRAYTAAFIELGLRLRWDEQMFAWLCGIECEKARVSKYIAEYHGHLLTAYDADFLSQLIFDKKSEYLRAVGQLN